MKNTRGNIQRKSGKALYNVTESLPGDWQTFTDNNIRLAEQEREVRTAVQHSVLNAEHSLFRRVSGCAG